jgi:hypothetical protein
LVASLRKVARMDSWGFEEDDEPDPRPAAGDELLTGSDAGGIVTVAVDDAGGVRTVRLGAGWQETDTRRGLGGKVVEAMIAATAHVIAQKTGPAPQPVAAQQEGPITAEDVLRVLHAVSVDLTRFRERLSAVADETVRVASGGGHVTVAGRQRQVSDVVIDQDWLYGARASEVESELRDALAAFGDRSSPKEVVPRGDAIGELLGMVADPRAMVRRLREGSPS